MDKHPYFVLHLQDVKYHIRVRGFVIHRIMNYVKKLTSSVKKVDFHAKSIFTF